MSSTAPAWWIQREGRPESRGAPQPAELFAGTGQLEAASLHGTVGGLAAVAGNGAAPAVAVDGDGQVDLDPAAAPELGAELGIERGGDRFPPGPGEHPDVDVGCSGAPWNKSSRRRGWNVRQVGVDE
jgi:hypothetical protein